VALQCNLNAKGRLGSFFDNGIDRVRQEGFERSGPIAVRHQLFVRVFRVPKKKEPSAVIFERD
jgi:hypothetical protein